ncbi:hypothetical protein NR798_24310 [Archangium gephyra]|uniref:hypothetical protein n=1 Tax=Archangium gephyra TaxID=48 RepID=UPI0035D4B279
MKNNPWGTIEGRKELFSGVLGGILVLGLVASFIGAWIKIDNPETFARAKDLVQYASSIAAVVIGYYFGAVQSRTGAAAAHSEAAAARARLEMADAAVDNAIDKYEMRGGAAPGSPPQAHDEAYDILRAYSDKREKLAHRGGAGQATGRMTPPLLTRPAEER